MNILLFAGLKELLGDQDVDVDVVGKSVAQVKDVLVEKFPEAESLIRRSHFAVGHDYVSDSFVFESPPAEIALIPPVSGG